MPAIFSFPHTCRAVRRSQVGDEDGTPIWDDGVHVPSDANPALTCRIDFEKQQRRISPNRTGAANEVVLGATVFIEDYQADVQEEDSLDVYTAYGSTVTRWRVDGITVPETLMDPDHMEVFVSRVVNG